MTPDQSGSSGFHLRDLVNEVMDKNPKEANPHTLALSVLAKLDPSSYSEALEQTLPGFVRGMVGEERRAILQSPNATDSKASAPRSAKWEKAGRSRLEARLRVAGGWKRLGDCTSADLVDIASQYDARAEESRWWADRYREMAALMERTGATQLRSVPDVDMKLALIFNEPR